MAYYLSQLSWNSLLLTTKSIPNETVESKLVISLCVTFTP